MAYAYGMGHGFGFGLGFLNFLGTILFIIFLVWAVKFFVRGGRGYGWGGRRGPWGRYDRRRTGGQDDAAETARERFARGEMTAEQYEAIKKRLDADETGRAASAGDWLPWNRDQALETARLRFARGEISAEEFETVKRVLQS